MKKIITTVFQSWRWTLVAVFFAALLVRGVFVFTLQDGFYFPDSIEYSRAAVNLINNGELGENYHRPPGYPAFLATIYLLFGDNILAVRLVESVLGALLAVVIALIGSRIAGPTVGAIAGLLWTIYPLGIFIAGLVYPTTLVTVLLACGVLCFLPDFNQEPSSKRLFVGGALLGLAALTVPVVVATIGVVGLWLIYWIRIERLRRVSLLFLGTALVIVPWAIRDYYVYDKLVIVEPRAVQHLPRMRGADPELRQRRIEAILKHPGEYASRIGKEFLHFWQIIPDRVAMDQSGYREKWNEKYPQLVKKTIFTTNDLIKVVSILSTGPLFLFAVLGTVAMLFEPERRRHLALLCAVILSFAVIYSLFFTQTRYRIPIEPYIAILSAYGLKKTWDLLARRFARRAQVGRQVKVQAHVKAEV